MQLFVRRTVDITANCFQSNQTCLAAEAPDDFSRSIVAVPKY